MTDITWVETAGKTIDDAVSLALNELGLGSPDQADIEVLQEPQKGFLGMGGRPALVRVKPQVKSSTKKRRRSRSKSKSRSGGPGDRSDGAPRSPTKTKSSSGGSRPKESSGSRSSASSSSGSRSSRNGGGGSRSGARADRSSSSDRKNTRGGPSKATREPKGDTAVEADVKEQARVIEEFLTGLLGAFGLDGEVTTRIDDETVYADVTGDQTETLVGHKGSVLQSINELTRTVVQRKTQAGVRLRLDIGGYVERRREALRIYAGRLAERVLESGEEIMLEPMNSADRKVVHDAITDLDGVRTFSEGEDPKRYVVITKA